jgi:hypothetical protein
MSRTFFRKARSAPTLSPEALVREGHAVRAAAAALPDAAAVRLFLNSHHAGLSGRPLDLAVASAAGLAAVEAAICIEARRSTESC